MWGQYTITWMLLSLVCLPLTMFHTLPPAWLCTAWAAACIPHSHISWLPSGCDQWDTVIEDYRMGGMQRQGCSSSLHLWVNLCSNCFSSLASASCRHIHHGLVSVNEASTLAPGTPLLPLAKEASSFLLRLTSGLPHPLLLGFSHLASSP